MTNNYISKASKGLTTSLLFGLASCATIEAEAPYVAPTEGMFPVTAAFETPIVGSAGDSADDPAIYVHQSGSGFIAGTDKQFGLHIYALDGDAREFFPLGTLNNVDLRENFRVGGTPYVLLVASNDEKKNITALLYNLSLIHI